MIKRFYLPALVCAAILIGSCTHAPDSDKATTTEAKPETENAKGATYKANTATSKIEWIGTKVSGYHTGTVNLKSGELTVSNGALTGGNFVLDMSSITVTGPAKVKPEMSAKLQNHLLSPDFFDVTKFSEATFTITSVKSFTGDIEEKEDAIKDELNAYKVANPTHSVSGNLTMKGITKNIEFPAMINISDNSAEAIAKFNINRKQWGIEYAGQPDDLIRDEIYLGILLKAEK